MNISLSKVSVSKRMSQETLCFVADILIDGKKVGDARNDGWGGETFVNVDGANYARLRAFAETKTFEGFGSTFTHNVGSFIDTLVENWEAEKSTKRKMKGNVLFVEASARPGSYLAVKENSGNPARRMAVVAAWKGKYPTAVFADTDFDKFVSMVF